jgi:cytochrome c oxidase subunit 2
LKPQIKANIENRKIEFNMKKIITIILSILVGNAAFAAETAENLGRATPWQYSFMEAASPVMERLVGLHNMLLWVIFAISIFVLILLIYTCVRFREKANPVPSKTTHNVLIEIIWTVVPVMILLVIVISSWRLIIFKDKVSDPEITLKVTGYQWYWGYEYMDGKGQGIKFLSNMKKEADLTADEKAKGLRLLAVDNYVVLPVDTNIRILTTAADVIHAFAMPSFGIKIDAIPGRMNETWVKITKPGTYFGQCSELCGPYHAFMPIAIKAVSKEEYAKWVDGQKKG